MKKIIFATSFINSTQTGSAVFARLFIEWAKSHGYILTIVSDEPPSSDASYETIPLVSHNRIYKRIPLLNQFQRSFILYKTVETIVRKGTYDFVFFNNAIESLHTAKLLKDIPVYAMIHDENFMDDYKKNRSFKRKLFRNAMKRQEEKAMAHLDRILTNSKMMKHKIERIYDVHPLKVVYTYFRSFDLDNLVEKTQEIVDKHDEKRILFVKHDYERGGLKLLAEALEKIPQYKFKLRVVGVSSTKKRALASLLEGIDYEIIYNRSRTEIARDYQWCDIFCVPSQSEALGLANMEAMLFGKPIVALDLPVLRELSGDLPLMYLAQQGKNNQLASMIAACIDDEVLTQSHIVNARTFVQKNITKNLFHKSLDMFFGISHRL